MRCIRSEGFVFYGSIPHAPRFFSSISTSVSWILSYTVLNILELGWAVAPAQQGGLDTTGIAPGSVSHSPTALWLPGAHSQSSGSQHKPGPQKGVLSWFPWCRTSCRGRMGLSRGPSAGEALERGPWRCLRCRFLRSAASQLHTALPMAPLPRTSQGHRQQLQIFMPVWHQSAFAAWDLNSACLALAVTVAWRAFRQLWERPSQYFACLNKIFLCHIISSRWSCLLHNFDGCFIVGKEEQIPDPMKCKALT